MKRICILIYSSFFILHSSFAQGTWTWISGTDSVNAHGVFGTQGIPSVNNHPRASFAMASWKDKQGNFWIYGGGGAIGHGDLWKYNPVTNEWTWMKGDGKNLDHPVGTKGIANPSNTPGFRTETVPTWVDDSGALWLFSSYNWGTDLWKYDIATNEWTWVTGDTIKNSKGVYGVQGVPAPLNTPGSRYITSSTWTDSLNNLWLFGGYGDDANGTFDDLNDLWKYDITTNEWAWMKGSDTVNAPTNYGTKGVTSETNDPGARWTYTNWKDLQGNFWIMGGFAGDNGATLNDIWKYDLSLNEWTWMNGPDLPNDLGNYNANCVFDVINMPQSRGDQNSVTDNCGRFWLFGGVNNNYGGNNRFNDLWVFDPQQLKWNWISGVSSPDQPSNYGTIGIASSSNIPSSRGDAATCWGNDNKFYLFGGYQATNSYVYADLWVFDPDTNCVPVCAAPLYPLIASFESNTTALCANDCINFTDYSSNATSWQWNFAGGSPSLSTDENPQICYPVSGIYNATLIASNSAGSDTLTINNYITVDAAPSAPTLTQQHDTIFCSTNPSYTSYQWYLDSTLISGATDTILIFSLGGNYNVKVTNNNGCTIAVGINIVGIKEFAVSASQFAVRPNPANDKVTISSHSVSGKIDLSIKDVLGLNVYSSIETPNGVLNKDIDISNFSSGIYFVRISDKNGMGVLKFVKE